MPPKPVLITGVYGLIASAVYRRFTALPDRYEVYALARRRGASERSPGGQSLRVPDNRFRLVDLADLDPLCQAFEGIHTVVQMAADPRPQAPWESILHSNVIGAYHVFEAARRSGVKRVVFASSVMATWGYQADEPYKAIQEGRFQDVPDPIPLVTHRDMPRPTEPYSASKVWGEALARTYADVHGLSCICLRIGWVNAEDRPTGSGASAVWCSQRDIVQLVERAVDAPDDLRFDICYGISDNRYRWVDIDHARQVLGFVPQDRGEDRLQ